MNAQTDVLAIGETMAVVSPPTGTSLRAARTGSLGAGGAETNVARCLAQLGYHATWAGRLGSDPLGDLVLTEVAAAGVDVSMVSRDPDRPTGVYFKDPTHDRTEVYYYRAGSAATAMSGQDLLSWQRASPQVVHLTGITPALSGTCGELVDEVVRRRFFGPALVSFDVNYRPALWPEEDAAGPLLRLAQQSDIVFVGLDEAVRLWGTQSALEVREALKCPGHVVVKDDRHSAVSFDDGIRTEVPASSVEVVERVGAGDAFAAGWIASYLRGGEPGARLKTGHDLARRVLQLAGDSVVPHADDADQSLPLASATFGPSSLHHSTC